MLIKYMPFQNFINRFYSNNHHLSLSKEALKIIHSILSCDDNLEINTYNIIHEWHEYTSLNELKKTFNENNIDDILNSAFLLDNGHYLINI